MLVIFGIETLSKEISNMADADKDEIADVRREQNVVWWVGLRMSHKPRSRDMLRNMSISFVRTMSKLDVSRRERLLRGGQNLGN